MDSMGKKTNESSKSIVCSTDLGTARGYGYVYTVFPYDNCKIGICPQTDIWNTTAFISDHITWDQIQDNLYQRMTRSFGLVMINVFSSTKNMLIM